MADEPIADIDALPPEVRALVDRLRTHPWDHPGGLVNMREAADALLAAYREVVRLRGALHSIAFVTTKSAGRSYPSEGGLAHDIAREALAAPPPDQP